MAWIDRLKEIKSNLNLSAKEIASISGIPEPTLEKLFSGQTKNPGINSLQKLVHSLGYTLDDLDDEPKTAPLYSSEAMKIAAVYDRLDTHGQEMLNLVSEKELIRYNQEKELQAKALKQKEMEASEELTPIRSIRQYIYPPAAGYASPVEGEDYKIVELTNVPKGADFCVTVSGDSMEPYIKDGQLVFVQRNADLTDFDVGVFYLDGDVLIKQLAVDSFRNVYLLSANPKRQDANRMILHNSSSTLICYGKVLLPEKLPRPNY